MKQINNLAASSTTESSMNFQNKFFMRKNLPLLVDFFCSLRLSLVGVFIPGNF